MDGWMDELYIIGRAFHRVEERLLTEGRLLRARGRRGCDSYHLFTPGQVITA
jgi:hypothetical protein